MEKKFYFDSKKMYSDYCLKMQNKLKFKNKRDKRWENSSLESKKYISINFKK